MDSELSQRAPEPRQRWRLVFARTADAADSLTPSNAGLDGLSASLESAGIEVARAGKRPKVSLAAPLPSNTVGERELADLYLLDRYPISAVRAAIERGLPAGHRLVDLHDVWLGEPALPGQVVAADYRIELQPTDAGADALVPACEQLLAASTIPRERLKGDRTVAYDLRPLLADLRVDRVEGEGSGPATIRFRTRIDPERGAGRADEVLAAIAAASGVVLAAASTTRTRVWLATDGKPGSL